MNNSAIGVRLQSNGDYWQAAWVDGLNQKRVKSLGPKARLTKKAALRACAALAVQHDVQPALRDIREAPTLKDWCDRYERLRTDIKPSTLRLQLVTAAYLRERFGDDTRIDRISRQGADEWRAWLSDAKKGKGLGEQTVCCHVRTAKVIMGRAVKTDLLPFNPFDRLSGTAPAVKANAIDLSDDAVRRLIDAAPGPSWQALIGLCALAGLRRGEALALEWSEVHWDRHRLTVKQGKTGLRDVRLEPALAKILLDCHEATEGPSVVSVGGDDLHRTMVRIIKAAGMKPWPKPFHALRGWRATTWRQTYPEYVVDAWLGHSLAVARKHYVAPPEAMYAAGETGEARIARLEAELNRLRNATKLPQTGPG